MNSIYHPLTAAKAFTLSPTHSLHFFSLLLPLVCYNLYYFLPSSQSKYEFDEIITNTQSIIILVWNGILWNSIMKGEEENICYCIDFFYLDLWFSMWLLWCVWCYTIFSWLSRESCLFDWRMILMIFFGGVDEIEFIHGIFHENRH